MLSQPGKPRAVGGGVSKHLTQTLAYSNELCALTARLTKLSKSMTIANKNSLATGADAAAHALDMAAQFELQAELGECVSECAIDRLTDRRIPINPPQRTAPRRAAPT